MPYHVEFRGLSPVRKPVLSPPIPERAISPKRRPYGGEGGPVRGRAGLPGGWVESRGYSPERPSTPVKKEQEVDEPSTKESSSSIANAWRGSTTGSQNSEALAALWQVGGSDKSGAIYSVLLEEGVVEGETDAEAKIRLEEELEAERNRSQQLLQALLRCEAVAEPHTINAEFKEEWNRLPSPDTILSTRDRCDDTLCKEIPELVYEACSRLHSRVDSVLDELCQTSQDIHRLNKIIEEKDTELAVLKAHISTLQADLNMALSELERFKNIEEKLKESEEDREDLRKKLAAAERLIAKLELEIEQLQKEMAQLIKRTRTRIGKKAAHELQSTYLEPHQKKDIPGPAWVPVGSPFKHLLDEDPVVNRHC